MNSIVPYRPHVTGVTIDGRNIVGYPDQEVFPGVTDYDDGVFAEKVPGGWRLEVHIANVALAVRVGSKLDLAALMQGFTRYGPWRTKHALTNRLANTALSLLPHQLRQTVTVVIHLDDEFCVVDSEVKLTQFTSRARLYLSDVGTISQNPNHEHHDLVRRLVTVAVNLRAQMKGKSLAVPIDEVVEEKWYLNNKCCGDRVIQSLMILANCQFAEFCIQHKIPIIFRNFDITTDAYALYGIENKGHSIAQGRGYAHTTSPIRRVIDKVNQDMVLAWLLGLSPPRSLSELTAIAAHVNGLVADLRESRETYDRVFGGENGNGGT
ncbi:MAG: RNB domain-containing ribonuclease [Candidatus Jacksonbacteria bacterium]|nr:RNB domain-containing ribonuclease [Candidatus Jacksonbacteria bacterium]